MPLHFPIRLLAGCLGAVGLAGAALVVPASPALAAGNANLTVTLARDPAALKPGKRVSYRIFVRNLGPATAAKVSVDFITTAALTSPTATVSTGRCLRSPLETACLFGTVKSGGSAWATISGILPGKLPPGTVVKNSVTVTSDTPLADPAHGSASADYTMPGGSGSPTPGPSPSASGGDRGAAASASPGTRGHGELWWVVIGLAGVAAVALASGLTLAGRRRAQSRRGAQPGGSVAP